MQNKNEYGKLDDTKFCKFLTKITAFIFAYAITNPGVNTLRTPIYAEMVNIIEEKKVEFTDFKFEKETIEAKLNNGSSQGKVDKKNELLAKKFKTGF